MVKALRKLGYRVVGLPCNTADYGLPQQRCRAWVMCILESECDRRAHGESSEGLQMSAIAPGGVDF